jgi:hypothetical protein
MSLSLRSLSLSPFLPYYLSYFIPLQEKRHPLNPTVCSIPYKL